MAHSERPTVTELQTCPKGGCRDRVHNDDPMSPLPLSRGRSEGSRGKKVMTSWIRSLRIGWWSWMGQNLMVGRNSVLPPALRGHPSPSKLCGKGGGAAKFAAGSVRVDTEMEHSLRCKTKNCSQFKCRMTTSRDTGNCGHPGGRAWMRGRTLTGIGVKSLNHINSSSSTHWYLLSGQMP